MTTGRMDTAATLLKVGGVLFAESSCPPAGQTPSSGTSPFGWPVRPDAAEVGIGYCRCSRCPSTSDAPDPVPGARHSPRTRIPARRAADGGATFSPQGVAVPAGGNSGSLGPITWVWTGGGILQETTDGGQTWTAITAVGLPINVSSLDLTGPTSATAVIVDSGCAGFKTDCWYRYYLVATTDGGRTWTHL